MDLRVCSGCGDRPAVPQVLPERPVLVCAICGHQQEFLRLPMFALTGPSGTGKSTISRSLAAELGDRVVVVEQDVLWAGGLRDPDDDYGAFRSTWLTMVGMLHQSGRPVVLCGTVVPIQFERRPERAFIGKIHYLALTCKTDVLAHRLRARPAWREWDEPRIAETLEFNDWLIANAAAMDPPVTLLDNTIREVGDTVREVAEWVRAGLDE